MHVYTKLMSGKRLLAKFCLQMELLWSLWRDSTLIEIIKLILTGYTDDLQPNTEGLLIKSLILLKTWSGTNFKNSANYNVQLQATH